MPQKLNDFFSDKTPTAEEKLTMFDLRNKNADLSPEEKKKRAEKIDCFPLMQVIKKVGWELRWSSMIFQNG